MCLWEGSSQQVTFWKGKRVKRFRYAKAHEYWNEDQWKSGVMNPCLKFLGAAIDSV